MGILGLLGIIVVVLLVARVDDGVIDDHLLDGVALAVQEKVVPCRAAHQVGVLLIDRLQVFCDGFVGRGKDGVASASSQQLGHGTLTHTRDGNQLNQLDLFAVGFVLLNIRHHRFILEDVSGRRIDILLAAQQRQCRHEQNAELLHIRNVSHFI